MAGIVGLDRAGQTQRVERMLGTIAHRGGHGSKIVKHPKATLGVRWPGAQVADVPSSSWRNAVWDSRQPLVADAASAARTNLPFAVVIARGDGLFAARDPLGVRPLYFGKTSDGVLCFASEVKALAGEASDVREFPPGYWYQSGRGFRPYARLEPVAELELGEEEVASGLLERLRAAVASRVTGATIGSWLSGGLDSSAMVALARPLVRKLYTFAGGVEGAPDLEYARVVAEHMGTLHHEVVLGLKDMLDALPDVIYHLESFDALLVRSTITNYLVAKRAAGEVGSVLSGEGGDELFAGYEYLQQVPLDDLQSELVDITGRLHNTALQRVDRSASAHGLVAHVPFLDPTVVDYALSIPARLKSYRQGQPVSKWILRKALDGLLPESVVWRPKAKFWEGAGVGDMLAAHADATISDSDFAQERRLSNGWLLNSKEDLLYYRVFSERLGGIKELSWMGRTKGREAVWEAPQPS